MVASVIFDHDQINKLTNSRDTRLLAFAEKKGALYWSGWHWVCTITYSTEKEKTRVSSAKHLHLRLNMILD